MSRRRLLAAALAAPALLAAAVADDAPAPLKFAWPVPSKVTVTERVFRPGAAVTTRYTASLERAGDGDDLKLRFADFEVVDFAGKKPDDPSVAARVAATVRMASKLMPDLLLGADGKVKDVVGIDAAIRAMLDDVEKGGTDEEKAWLPARRAQLESPEVKESMKREATKPWQAWVGEWAGRTMPDGEDVPARHCVRDLDGSERDAPAVLRRVASSEGAGLVTLTREAMLDGDDTKASLDAWVKAGTKAIGHAPPEGLFIGLQLVSRAAAVADAATLRPRRAMREDACLVHRKGDADLVVELDRHEYAFEWPASETPKPPAAEK